VRDHDPLVLKTVDGVRVSARIDPGPDGSVRAGTGSSTALLVAHGFTGNIREERVRRVVRSLSAYAPVMSIDLRGHGHSSGESTVGMDEVLDVDVAVGHLRDLGFERVVSVGFSMGGSVVLRHGAMAPAAADRARIVPRLEPAIRLTRPRVAAGLQPAEYVGTRVFGEMQSRRHMGRRQRDDEAVAPGGQLGGQRLTDSLGGTGDDGSAIRGRRGDWHAAIVGIGWRA
jgi:pimeloyl-ACP methyl ester carboxylesterase